MNGERGFVTIATGRERYFLLARNLLYSYRQFASVKYPFAIICDKENAYTAEFDKVVVLEQAYGSYLDKLQLYDVLPYEETIFIDADSLAYGDLDCWWDIFKNADAFSCFGYAWTDLKAGRGWFLPNGVLEYQNKISYVPDFNGGVYYLRKSETCEKVFLLANDFAKNYEKYAFTNFKTPADEPCLALAMAVYQCMPVDLYEVAFAPKKSQMDLDISLPKARFYKKKEESYDVKLIHWSNYKTRQALYKFEVEKLMYKVFKKPENRIDKILYKRKWKYYILRLCDVLVFAGRVVRKIKRTLRI